MFEFESDDSSISALLGNLDFILLKEEPKTIEIEPVKTRISQITTDGLLKVQFNQDINIPDNFANLLESDRRMLLR